MISKQQSSVTIECKKKQIFEILKNIFLSYAHNYTQD